MSALAPRQPLIFDDLMIETLCKAFKEINWLGSYRD